MSQHTDKQLTTDAVTEFFAAIEAGRWDESSTLLADQVHVAHGPQGMMLSRENLITRWREHHAAFSRTSYRLGPLDIQRTGQHRTTVRCSARVTMHRPADLGDRPEVIVGHYTIDLQRATGTWRISTMRHDEHLHEAPPSTAG